MIDIYSDEYNEQELNRIFNGGVAGIAKNCTARVEKKTDADAANHPKYKIIYTDEKGGEINEGYFDNLDLPTASDKAKKYFIKSMRHLLSQSGTKISSGQSTYSEILDAAMKELYKAMPKNKYNLAVQFGTKEYPKAFLEPNGYWGVLNVESDRLPNTHKDALMERPTPDNVDKPEKSELDLGQDSGEVTEDETSW